MKKYLLCVLPLLLATSSIGFCQNVIFFYDFNNEEVGKPPSPPWKATPAGEIEVVEFPSQANKSVKITDKGSGAGMQLILDDVLDIDIATLEFKWYREEEGAATGIEIFYVMNQKCADDWSGVCVTTEGKSYQYNDSGAWIAGGDIVDKTWHDIRFVMDIGRNKYDFYWDNEQIAKNAGFRKSDGIKGIDKFNAANVGNGGYTFIVHFDDIMLYEGSEKPKAVESKNKLANVWGRIKLLAGENSYMEYPGGHKGTRFEKGLQSRNTLVPF